MESKSQPMGPYRLVTINKAPERARALIARVIEALRDKYEIEHVANCESMDKVESTVLDFQPDLLFCASMWLPAEADQIQSIAKEAQPGILTYALPHGLQAEKGSDAVVSHLTERLPELLVSHEQRVNVTE